ncbi:hypothetical protein NDU88_012109 [Pleurodeles waltl]|uniref:Uncharacterized protein n=1 Tax=Pleurodeles waltl TaxID=8319 RepID=A0AAV7R2Z5_PLEWA|nr:hypothetical protein NDU88_012109 [Pleurodeles waltl]
MDELRAPTAADEDPWVKFTGRRTEATSDETATRNDDAGKTCGCTEPVLTWWELLVSPRHIMALACCSLSVEK